MNPRATHNIPVHIVALHIAYPCTSSVFISRLLALSVDMKHTRRKVGHSFKVCLGNLLCSLVVFVRALQYPFSSFAPILFLISTAMVADSVHIGAHATGAAITLSMGIFGSLLAAMVFFIASSDAGVLCLSLFAVVPICLALRFGHHPKYEFMRVLMFIHTGHSYTYISDGDI